MKNITDKLKDLKIDHEGIQIPICKNIVLKDGSITIKIDEKFQEHLFVEYGLERVLIENNMKKFN